MTNEGGVSPAPAKRHACVAMIEGKAMNLLTTYAAAPLSPPPSARSADSADESLLPDTASMREYTQLSQCYIVLASALYGRQSRVMALLSTAQIYPCPFREERRLHTRYEGVHRDRPQRQYEPNKLHPRSAEHAKRAEPAGTHVNAENQPRNDQNKIIAESDHHELEMANADDSVRRPDRLGTSGNFETDYTSTSRSLGSQREHRHESTIKTDREQAGILRWIHHHGRCSGDDGNFDTRAQSTPTGSQHTSTTQSIRADRHLTISKLLIHEVRSQPKSARDTSKSTKSAERADPARINDLRISSNNREAQPQTSDWMKRETLPEPTMMPEQLAKTRANQRQEKAQMHNRLEISGKRSENAERAGSANASYKTRIAETSDNFNRCTNTRSQYHVGIQTAGTPTDKTCEIRTRPTTKDVTPAESDDQDAKTSVEADQHENRPRKDATTAEPDQHEIQSAAAAGTSIDTFNDAKNRKTRTRADVDEAIAGLLLEPEHPCVTRMHAYTTRCERRAGMLRVGPERQYRSLEYYGTHIRKTVSGMHHYDTRHALQWAHMSGATICD